MKKIVAKVNSRILKQMKCIICGLMGQLNVKKGTKINFLPPFIFIHDDFCMLSSYSTETFRMIQNTIVPSWVSSFHCWLNRRSRSLLPLSFPQYGNLMLLYCNLIQKRYTYCETNTTTMSRLNEPRTAGPNAKGQVRKQEMASVGKSSEKSSLSISIE